MSKKISVDLTDENAGALYQNKEVHGLGYGPTINMLIRIFFRSPDIRDDLIEICKSKIQSGNLVYLDMLQFLTYDTQLTLDAVLERSENYEKNKSKDLSTESAYRYYA